VTRAENEARITACSKPVWVFAAVGAAAHDANTVYAGLDV
jgi:hypothetical protein